MEKLPGHYVFNTKKAVAIKRQLPVVVDHKALPLTCSHCRFINEPGYKFCTNCGYPVHPQKDTLLVYELRTRQRKNFLDQLNVSISYARNALYIISACALLGFSFLFSERRETMLRGFLLVLVGMILLALARWSLRRPFTSLLISFLIILTTAAITAWSSFDELFTTVSGVYILFGYLCLIYFVLRGVKAAYQADVLQDEFKI